MVNLRLVVAGGVFGSLFALASAAGQSVQVEMYDSAGSLVQPAQNFASGSAINLGSVSTSVARINIFSVGSGLANVGGVTFVTATRSSELVVFLGQGLPPQDVTVEIPEVANNWGGLSVNAATQEWIRLSAGMAGDLTGPVFSGTIDRLQIAGVQGGAINASATLGDALDIKYVRALRGDGTGATITTPGAIGTIEMTGVALPNAITATISAGEFMQTIECAGLIGNDNVRPRIVARDGIGSIVAEQINANIRANANGGQGALGRIEVSSRVLMRCADRSRRPHSVMAAEQHCSVVAGFERT